MAERTRPREERREWGTPQTDLPLQREVPIRTQTPPSAQQRSLLEKQLNYPTNPGHHTVSGPAVGSRANETQTLITLASTRPEIGVFASALYDDTPNRFLIRPNQEAAAERDALRIYKVYLARYPNSGLNEKNSVDWAELDMTRTFINDAETQVSTWNAQPVVYSGRTVENGFLLPKYLRAYHEFMHVEEMPLRSKKDWDQQHGQLTELMPTIATIVIADQINKDVNSIPLNREYNYNKSVSWNGHTVSVGRLANFYRTLYNNYGSWGAAINSPESLEFMRTGVIRPNMVFSNTGF